MSFAQENTSNAERKSPDSTEPKSQLKEESTSKVDLQKNEEGPKDFKSNEGEEKPSSTEAVMDQPPIITEPLEIGDECQVEWRNGSKKLAKIVERRAIHNRKRKKKNGNGTLDSSESHQEGHESTSTSKETKNIFKNLKADQVEYYVHFIDYDRRLDEWIKLDKFDLSTLDLSKRASNEQRAAAHGSNPDQPQSRRSRRERRKSTANYDESGHGGGNAVDQSLAAFEREHEEITKVKNISKIIIGKWEVFAWYFSPYPEEYAQEERLFVCDFCLTYCKNVRTFRRHKTECPLRSPPGDEIYRENDLSVFEVDGKDHRVYCQNLCLLAKLFLDHKTLYYDVEPFIFYIITQVDVKGAHIVGYFSKEKVSAEDYNLACILTFPQYQKHGYGKFIISLSYELSKRERKTGSPEKPLSDLGKISYRSYWTYVLMTLLSEEKNRKSLGIREISNLTAIKTEDIISTLQSLNMIKFWKGQHVIFVEEQALRDYMKQKKKIRLCKSEFLTWDPYSQKRKND